MPAAAAAPGKGDTSWMPPPPRANYPQCPFPCRGTPSAGQTPAPGQHPDPHSPALALGCWHPWMVPLDGGPWGLGDRQEGTPLRHQRDTMHVYQVSIIIMYMHLFPISIYYSLFALIIPYFHYYSLFISIIIPYFHLLLLYPFIIPYFH